METKPLMLPQCVMILVKRGVGQVFDGAALFCNPVCGEFNLVFAWLLSGKLLPIVWDILKNAMKILSTFIDYIFFTDFTNG